MAVAVRKIDDELTIEQVRQRLTEAEQECANWRSLLSAKLRQRQARGSRRLLELEQAAERLGLSEMAVLKLCDAGLLVPEMVGTGPRTLKRPVFSLLSLMQFEQRRRDDARRNTESDDH